MLLYLLLTVSVIVLILFLCRDKCTSEKEEKTEALKENFSSRNTPINLYNGINNTNNRANQIKSKLDTTRDPPMTFYDEVERLRMKKQIAKKVV
jgi:hypothetical protein